jgi:hypothetical protein
MSNEITKDMEELEGVLLLPVATEVVGPNQNSNAASATLIPSAEAVFDYDAAVVNEQKGSREDNGDEAVVVPDNGNQLNFAGVSDDSKSTVGKAQQTGKIRSEEELESIRKANRKVFSQNYHEKNDFKSANEYAKQRDREGLQMKSDNYVEEQTNVAKEPPKQAQQQQKPQKPKGYQVKEYDCGAYETGAYETSTYKVTEYKSVYD